jgi:hypothetical protein
LRVTPHKAWAWFDFQAERGFLNESVGLRLISGRNRSCLQICVQIFFASSGVFFNKMGASGAPCIDLVDKGRETAFLDVVEKRYG